MTDLGAARGQGHAPDENPWKAPPASAAPARPERPGPRAAEPSVRFWSAS
jgi:hypothetical protein